MNNIIISLFYLYCNYKSMGCYKIHLRNFTSFMASYKTLRDLSIIINVADVRIVFSRHSIFPICIMLYGMARECVLCSSYNDQIYTSNRMIWTSVCSFHYVQHIISSHGDRVTINDVRITRKEEYVYCFISPIHYELQLFPTRVPR